MEQVLALYQEEYYDLNVRHFREKLEENHGIQLSYTWVYQALAGAGLVQNGASAENTGASERDGRCLGAPAC